MPQSMIQWNYAVHSMHVDQEQLKKLILDSGMVSKGDFEKAEKKAEEKDVTPGEILVSEEKISEDDYRRMQAYVLGVPYVDLKDRNLDHDVLAVVPEPVARNHNIAAYKKSDEGLEVAMLDTEDLTAIDFLKKKTGLKILPRLTDKESIRYALKQYQKSLKAEFGDIIQKEAESLKTITPGDADGQDVSEKDLKKLADEVPVVRIVDTLIKHAIIQNASDIHIEPQEKKLVVRYRIDGILHDAMVLPKNVAPSITARVKVLAGLKLDEKRLPQDGRFKTETDAEKVSFRVSTLPTQYGEKTVMRLLREDVSGFTLESLGFHGKGLEAVHKAIKSTTGMILTTGPTGSGKTTTLYTVLDILNTPKVNISTIEDPVEYQMTRVNQSQVKPDIGFSFANGLRTLLRQDPDIIMVGEIRDTETANLAVNAALTGHLVLSTIHTNSAAGAIPRLVDMKVEPFLIVSTLNVIVAQRLVRQLTDKVEKYKLSEEELETLRDNVNLDTVLHFLREENIVDKNAEWSDIPFYRPKESLESPEDAYSGRLGIYEILPVSSSIKDMVARNASAEQMETQARKEGMMTMAEDGIFKAAQGLTSIEEVLRVISE